MIPSRDNPVNATGYQLHKLSDSTPAQQQPARTGKEGDHQQGKRLGSRRIAFGERTDTSIRKLIDPARIRVRLT